MPKILLFIFSTPILILNCVNSATKAGVEAPATPISEQPVEASEPIQVGAAQLLVYLPLLEGKRVGMVVNQSSLVPRENPAKGSAHLVDTLQSRKVELIKIFALEHGFRGTEDAGAIIQDGVDVKSGLPIVTLYGKKKEPSAEDLADIDLIIFDIQDVGARFYTYISSLHYIMQGLAKAGKPLLILDRPNPNGHYVDGPVLDPAYRSFVGMHPVPVVHGLTIGEYGRMINGEKWLDDGLQAPLTIVPCQHYRRTIPYPLPVAPSPNLPNFRSILLYPSLCFFEGTIVSIGRGTPTQFQVMGHPYWQAGDYRFTPMPGPGSADPKLGGQECIGFSLTQLSEEELHRGGQLDISYLLQAHNALREHNFFDRADFFDKLAGSDQLRKQITGGLSEDIIRASWQADLADFKAKRQAYLLYEE